MILSSTQEVLHNYVFMIHSKSTYTPFHLLYKPKKKCLFHSLTNNTKTSYAVKEALFDDLQYPLTFSFFSFYFNNSGTEPES